MKSAAAFFSMYILLLTFAPTLSMASAFVAREQCKKSCCSTPGKADSKQADHTTDCCKNACNPFMICCNCWPLAAQQQRISPLYVYSDLQFSSLTEPINHHYLSDCWHPPKI